MKFLLTDILIPCMIDLLTFVNNLTNYPFPFLKMNYIIDEMSLELYPSSTSKYFSEYKIKHVIAGNHHTRERLWPCEPRPAHGDVWAVVQPTTQDGGDGAQISYF